MTFNNGVRVRLTKDHDGKKAGPEGVVVKTNVSGTYHVKFDAPFNGHGEDGRCWNVPASKLALVAAPLKLEAGEFYRDANGKKRGPLIGSTFKWECGHGLDGDPEWNNYGTALIGGVDLVSKWVDEPAAAAPKVGDWVKDSEGDIGIVFHDDGDATDNLHVGFVDRGNFHYYSASALTVVPAGTVAANDNAPILAEIETLQSRIDALRASIA